MRTILAVIGAIALLIVAAVAGFVYYAVSSTKPLLDEAVAYANESVAAIAAEWNEDELVARAAPELEALLTPDFLSRFSSAVDTQLGAMTAYDDDATCALASFFVTSENGEVVTANCVATATFEKNDGLLHLALVKRDETWRLFNFFVYAAPDEDQTPPELNVRAPGGPLSHIEVSFSKGALGVSRSSRIAPGFGLYTEDKILSTPLGKPPLDPPDGE